MPLLTLMSQGTWVLPVVKHRMGAQRGSRTSIHPDTHSFTQQRLEQLDRALPQARLASAGWSKPSLLM